MLTKNSLQQLMREYDLKPNKLLGQNFLIDKKTLDKIVAAAELNKEDTVLEVGPGLGILTEELAKHAGRVMAVEKDKKMAKIVKSVLDNKKIENVEIVEGDILKIGDLKFYPEYCRGAKIGNYKVVANIPYYLTARLIRKFLEAANPPSEMILMIQKEVAQRICAKPPKMSLLAVAVQFYAQPKIISFISKKCFWPSPKVDSAIVRLTPHSIYQNIEASKFFRIVRAGFAHPRKQLINNLSTVLRIDRSEIEIVLKKIGLRPKQRAETLEIKDWVKLTQQLSVTYQ